MNLLHVTLLSCLFLGAAGCSGGSSSPEDAGFDGGVDAGIDAGADLGPRAAHQIGLTGGSGVHSSRNYKARLRIGAPLPIGRAEGQGKTVTGKTGPKP